MDNQLKVRFKIGEIEFEAEGSANDVERERESFKDTLLPLAIDAMVRTRGVVEETQYIETVERPAILSANAAETAYLSAASTADDLLGLSLNEFVKAKGFKSKIDLAIGLIYYFEIGKGCSSFSSDELKGYFSMTKETAPTNPSDVVYRLIGKAYIMQTSEKGRYQLTRTGMDFVDQFIAPVKTDKRVSSKRSRSKITSVYASLNADDLNIKNYPEIKAQNAFKKQMILTLYIDYNEGHGDAFSTADVQCLMTEKLGLHTTVDMINGVFKREKTWFTSINDETNKGGIKHRLLEGAKDFAKSIIDGTVKK
jgi:hypothetical protein